MSEAATALTEAEVLSLLGVRLAERNPSGSGYRHVVARHVRLDAGFAGTRTLDAVSLDTWASSGLALSGYEVKVSRADWLRELADPDKAECWRAHLDFMWLIAPKGVVRDDLPEWWGWLEVQPTRLVQRVPAPRLHPKLHGHHPDRRPVDRGLFTTMLRAATRKRGDL